MKFRHLLSGFDTIECAYFLAEQGQSLLDWGHLAAEKESLRQSKCRRPTAKKLGNEEFLLASHGTSSGFPFLLENDSFSIQCGEFNTPNFFVTFRSHALWHQGASALHQRFLAWAYSVGLTPSKPEALSRVDFTFDYWIDDIDFGVDNFLSMAVKDHQHRSNGKVQTFCFGSTPIQLRVYNKTDEIRESSGKEWFVPLWGGQSEDVWRIEWQIRKDELRKRGIRTFADLDQGQGDVLRPLVMGHTVLRLPSVDPGNPFGDDHPLWIDLRQRVQALNALGVERECDPQAQLHEREMRCAIAVYGYLKRLGAIDALSRHESSAAIDDAMRRLQWLLGRLHDPLTWQIDVQRRITEMRLGQ